MNKLQQLREIVRDETRPAQERKTAAEHYITAMVDGVLAPVDDDNEVQSQMKPWADGPMKNFWSDFPKLTDGCSLSDARKEVHTRNQLRAVLAVVTDGTVHRLEQLAACQWLLDNYGHIQKWSLNHCTSEKLLDTVVEPTAYKWTSSGKLPVERPPKSMQDVWEF